MNRQGNLRIYVCIVCCVLLVGTASATLIIPVSPPHLSASGASFPGMPNLLIEHPQVNPDSGVTESPRTFQYDARTGAWSAVQSDQHLGIVVTPDGRILFAGEKGAAGMRLAGFGRDQTISGIPGGTIRAEGNRLDIVRPGYTEWYVSDTTGIEQGMTIPSRPEGSGTLTVSYTLSGKLNPVLAEQTLIFSDTTGPVLQYGGLFAYDATGRTLPALLALSGTTLSWQIDDRDAVYPITIDPTIGTQTAILKAPDPGYQYYFGSSVSLYNDTAVIGAVTTKIGSYTNAGQAYVFKNNGGTWTWTAILNASDLNSAGNGGFGGSVSLYNDTAVIGSKEANVNGISNAGQVYVFKNNGGTWNETARIHNSTVTDYYRFGKAVSLYNDTVAIGTERGRAFVFKNTSGAWTEIAMLNASDFDLQGEANFGTALSLYNDTLVIGSSGAQVGGHANAGQAYVFKNTSGTWTETTILSASDASDSANFGNAVSLYNDTAVIGAYNSNSAGSTAGQAYIFKNSGGTWTQTAVLHASDPKANGNFGNAVSVYKNIAFIGASGTEVGSQNYAGQTYIFNNTG